MQVLPTSSILPTSSDFPRPSDFLRLPVFLRPPDFLHPTDFLYPTDFLRPPDFLRSPDFLRPPDFQSPSDESPSTTQADDKSLSLPLFPMDTLQWCGWVGNHADMSHAPLRFRCNVTRALVRSSMTLLRIY